MVLCGMVWYGVVWFGMVWYGVVWCGIVWFDAIWKIALCPNRPSTRAPDISYGAIGTELRCACDGIGVGWCGVVYCDVVGYFVVWCGMVWCGTSCCWGRKCLEETQTANCRRDSDSR